MNTPFGFTEKEGEYRLNSRVCVREYGGRVEVFKDGQLYAVFAGNDRDFRKAVIIQLARIGAASFRELCAGFQVDRETLERYLIRSQERGLRGVVDDKPGPKGPWKADHATRMEVIREFVNEPGISDSEIARRVSARRPIQVDGKMVSRILKNAGLKPAPDIDVARQGIPASQLFFRFKGSG
jgi:transposase